IAEPGKGPGALTVTQATAEGKINENMGQATAAHVVPMSTPVQSAHGEQASQLENNINKPPGGSQKMVQKNAAAPIARIRELSKEAAPSAAPPTKAAGRADNLVDYLLE